MNKKRFSWIVIALTLAIMGLSQGVSEATLPSYEPFDYPAGELIGQGSTGVPGGYIDSWAEGPATTNGANTVLDSSLSYISVGSLALETSAGAAELTKASGLNRQDAYRSLDERLTSGTIYLSYLFQTDAESGPRQQYFKLFDEGNTGFPQLQIGTTDSGEFTVFQRDSILDPIVIGPADTETHMFLVKLDNATSDATVWLDPELNLTSDPADGTVYNAGFGLAFDTILFGTLSFGGDDAIRIDEIRMSTSIADVTPGVEVIFDPDFDGDGDVDGEDFLIWQRGESPRPLSAEDLALWEEDFGIVASPFTSASTAVPEPATGMMLMLGMAAVMIFRRDVVVF